MTFAGDGRLAWNQEAVGSNSAVPTIFPPPFRKGRRFFILRAAMRTSARDVFREIRAIFAGVLFFYVRAIRFSLTSAFPSSASSLLLVALSNLCSFLLFPDSISDGETRAGAQRNHTPDFVAFRFRMEPTAAETPRLYLVCANLCSPARSGFSPDDPEQPSNSLFRINTRLPGTPGSKSGGYPPQHRRALGHDNRPEHAHAAPGVGFAASNCERFFIPSCQGCGWRDGQAPRRGPQVCVGCASDTSILPQIRFSVKPQPLHFAQQFITPAFPSPCIKTAISRSAGFRYFGWEN